MQSTEMYILNDVVKLTGIPKQTLHAWERRYKAVVPKRQESNRRVYSRDEVYRLRLLKELVDSGQRIGNIANLDTAGLEKKLSARTDQTRFSMSDLLDVIEALDQETLDRTLTDYFLARGPVAFCQELILPTLREIGDRWEKSSLSVIAEHMFSASARNLLGLALNQGQKATGGLVAMFTTPEGEPHELAVLAAAVSAKMLGVKTIFLGPQSPPAELAAAAAKLDVDIVCIGSVVLPAAELKRQIDGLMAVLPQNMEVWLGKPEPLGPEFSARPRLRVFSDLFDYENAMRAKATLAAA